MKVRRQLNDQDCDNGGDGDISDHHNDGDHTHHPHEVDNTQWPKILTVGQSVNSKGGYCKEHYLS